MQCAACGKEIEGEPVMQTYSARYALPYQMKERGNWKWIALCPECAKRRLGFTSIHILRDSYRPWRVVADFTRFALIAGDRLQWAA